VESIIMACEPLSLSEREEIRVGIERAETDSEIGRRLGRPRCTIGREIARNGGRVRYRATRAQKRADKQRRRPKISALAADPVLAAHVTARLEAKDSPMTISIELARGVWGLVASISHEAIYQAIQAKGARGLRAGLHLCLHRRRSYRKHHHTATKDTPLGVFNVIASRPAIALERTEVGHLEGDLIIGAYNRSALVTVFDRASRHCWLNRFPGSRQADQTRIAVGQILDRIPERLRRSLTWDRGREMAEHHLIATTWGIDIYFADPHSPWQRPTNENGNGLIRRYVGKSTDLSVYNDDDLRAIEHRINTTPRRSLNWATAHNHYHQLSR
jgi:IS30 family transposase